MREIKVFVRRFRRIMYVVLITLTTVIGSSGCASIDRLTKYPAPPQVYGGTRTFLKFWTEDMKLDLPVVVFPADLCLTAVVDTLALPWTIPAANRAESN